MADRKEMQDYVNTQSLWKGHPDKWYQAGIELPYGIVTESLYPGKESDCREIWELLHISEGDIVGKNVLDVGCNTGYYAMRCKEIGAKSVTAFDNSEWIDSGIKFAEWKGIEIDWHKCDFINMDWNKRYDTVLALQVLYHLGSGRDALRLMGESCNEILILYTKVRSESFKPDGVHYFPTMFELEDDLRGFGFLIELVDCHDRQLLDKVLTNEEPLLVKVAIRANHTWNK